jgi:hypothetical protein
MIDLKTLRGGRKKKTCMILLNTEPIQTVSVTQEQNSPEKLFRTFVTGEWLEKA